MTTYPVLSQRNPRWADKGIGYSHESVGRYGCLFVSLLMMVCHDQPWRDAYVDSGMSCLKTNGNYTPRGGTYLQSFDVSECEPKEWGSVKCLRATGLYNGPFPTEELNALLAHLRSGQPAIIEVDPTPGAPGIGDGNTHFVLATGADANGTPRVGIHDPWFGDIDDLCPRYGVSNAAAIYRAIFYEVTHPKVMEEAR